MISPGGTSSASACRVSSTDALASPFTIASKSFCRSAIRWFSFGEFPLWLEYCRGTGSRSKLAAGSIQPRRLPRLVVHGHNVFGWNVLEQMLRGRDSEAAIRLERLDAQPDFVAHVFRSPERQCALGVDGAVETELAAIELRQFRRVHRS